MEKSIDNQEVTRQDDQIENVKLDLDKVLVEEVGAFGRYQYKVLAIALILVISVQLSPSEYVFTAARIRTRCLIEECETSADKFFDPPWLINAIPTSKKGDGFDNCHRFAYNYTGTKNDTNDNEYCPQSHFKKDVVPCDTFLYENQNTAVYDLQLACDEWRRSLIGFSRTFGQLISHPLTGFISDRWGRRTALFFNAFNGGWIGLTRYFVNTYPAFLATEFVESIFGGGGYACIFILLTEMVGPKNRELAGAISCTYVAMGNLALALLAWAIPNWRNLTLAIYIIILCLCPLIFLVSDSLRWLISKGKNKRAEKILKDMARTNGKQLSSETLAALKSDAKSKESISKQKELDDTWLIVLIFRYKPILLRCCITPIWWITLTFVYYGLTINSVNLKTGSKITNFMAVSCAEIPGFWASYFLINRVGRKPVLAGSLWICAIAIMAFLFVPSNYGNVSLSLYLVGKFSISCAVTAVYLYTSELYPTQHRHRLFAFSSAVGRIGSILAPLTPAFGDTIPYFLFGGLAVVTGLLTLAVPETLGTKLPDTMEEAANIGKPLPSSNDLELK